MVIVNTGRYVLVGSQKVHFHIFGKGPALVLFHPSPHSSEMLLPLAKQLANKYTVFCIDTPGYGKSDPLVNLPETLEDYVVVIHEAIKKLKLNKPLLYGSATGAQIAIRYALMYPFELSHIFIDNSAHFDEALTKQIVQHYFPDLTPLKNGVHLMTLWDIVSHMFQYFPWCFKTEEYALHRPQLPKEVLHAIAIDFLKAGASYSLAYRAAFQHEKAKYAQQLKVPTSIFRWSGSIICKYVDDLLAFDLPSCVEAVYIEGDATNRLEKIVNFMNDRASEFEASIISETLMHRLESDKKLHYNVPSNRPDITEDGTYLKQAWEMLENFNPEFNPEQVQECLIYWYTN